MDRQSSELDDEQIAAWHRDGFLILDRFIDGTTLKTLSDAYDEILSRRIVATRDRMLGNITRQVMMPSQAAPVFDNNPAVAAGLAIARQLLCVDRVERTFDMLIYKGPGHPHETPWHQDAAYAALPFAAAESPVPERQIQFWLPMDDVDIENSCMQFVPGYHRTPLLEHYVASGDAIDESRLLAIVDPEQHVDLTKRVVAEIPAGGATLHAAGTPHCTGPNRSVRRPRRAYIFNIAAV